MKTNEFIRRAEEIGYTVVEMNRGIFINSYNFCRAAIGKVKQNDLTLKRSDYDLAKLCVEYAETPIAEREEEKKYMVVLPDTERVAISLVVLKKHDDKIALWTVSKQSFETDDSFHLTEAEIKRNHEYLWQFAKEVKE